MLYADCILAKINNYYNYDLMIMIVHTYIALSAISAIILLSINSTKSINFNIMNKIPKKKKNVAYFLFVCIVVVYLYIYNIYI